MNLNKDFGVFVLKMSFDGHSLLQQPSETGLFLSALVVDVLTSVIWPQMIWGYTAVTCNGIPHLSPTLQAAVIDSITWLWNWWGAVCNHSPSTRLWYLQCIGAGDTTILHKVTEIHQNQQETADLWLPLQILQLCTNQWISIEINLVLLKCNRFMEDCGNSNAIHASFISDICGPFY